MKALPLMLVIVTLVSVLFSLPSSANTSVSLDFEDLTDLTGSMHSMIPHNPYHDVTFGVITDGAYSGALDHYDNPEYAASHSGGVFLFNAWGLDNLYIEFAVPVMFEGAWVGHPYFISFNQYNRANQFWFEGYLNGVKVGESAKLTLTPAMQLCQAAFPGEVNKVVFRRSPQPDDPDPASSFYTIDDMAFSLPSAAPPSTEDLTGIVSGLNLPQGTEDGLLSKITAVGQNLSDGNQNNNGAAINALEAFINQVNARRGKDISAEDADKLISIAQTIIDSTSSKKKP